MLDLHIFKNFDLYSLVSKIKKCSMLYIHMYGLITRIHYENTPIKIYRKFHLQKLKIFR